MTIIEKTISIVRLFVCLSVCSCTNFISLLVHTLFVAVQISTAGGGIKEEEMVPGSKNQTSSDCGIPLQASKPKIWSLADTAACKTPPPIVQSQHGAWMTNPYHHSHTHPHSSNNPHSHQSGDLSSMMMGNSPTNQIGNSVLQGSLNRWFLIFFFSLLFTYKMASNRTRILNWIYYSLLTQKKVSGSNSIQNTSHLHNTQQHQASNPQAIAGNFTNNPYSRYTGFLTYNTNNTIPHNTNNTNTPHQMQHPTLRWVSMGAHIYASVQFKFYFQNHHISLFIMQQFQQEQQYQLDQQQYKYTKLDYNTAAAAAAIDGVSRSPNRFWKPNQFDVP